jgi:hypothetical protein
VATQRFVEGEESGFESSEDEEVARGFFGRSRWPVYKQRREEQESRRERQTLCYIEKEGPLEAAIEDTVKRGGRGTSRREQQEKEELLAYVFWRLEIYLEVQDYLTGEEKIYRYLDGEGRPWRVPTILQIETLAWVSIEEEQIYQ